MQSVTRGSAAAEAGLRNAVIHRNGYFGSADLIVEIAGEEIDGYRDLVEVLGRHSPGDTVNLVFIRDGERIGTDVKLQALR